MGWTRAELKEKAKGALKANYWWCVLTAFILSLLSGGNSRSNVSSEDINALKDMDFNALVAAVGNKIDIAIAGMTVDEERKQSVDFSDNYYEALQYVIVMKDSEIAAAADLENKTIGCQLGTTGMFTAEDINGADVKSYNKAVDAVNDLMNGRLDAVIIDKNPAQVFAGKFSDKVKALDGADFEFEPEYYAIACPKGSALVADINKALKEIKEDGTFDKIVNKYIE